MVGSTCDVHADAASDGDQLIVVIRYGEWQTSRRDPEDGRGNPWRGPFCAANAAVCIRCIAINKSLVAGARYGKIDQGSFPQLESYRYSMILQQRRGKRSSLAATLVEPLVKHR